MEVIGQSGLDVELPSLVSTQVECEVKSNLRVQAISLAEMAEIMLPTETTKSNQLEGTGLTRITSKQVGQVESTQQV